jgi:hypothetical protein
MLSANERARILQAEWAALPPECLETLTFHDLKSGQRFIIFPTPSDNSSPVGLKETYTVFTKMLYDVKKSIEGVVYKTPHGRACGDFRTVFRDFPHETSVIAVK